MSASPRVVFDTNTVLSALIFRGGVAASLREVWRAGACRPLICAETVQELIRVLAYPKFGLSATEREELLADYLPYASVVDLPSVPPAVPQCRDPHDHVFLQLAAVGRVAAVVSGDKDLLALSGRTRHAILAPGPFLHWLETRR